MAMDIPKWLKEDLRLSDDQVASIAPVLQADGRADLIEKGYLRQSDYSRRMNEGQSEIERQRQELAAANERLTTEMVEWGQREAKGKEQTEAQIRRMEAAEARVLQLQQALNRTATAYGLDPAQLVPGDPPPAAPPQPAAPAFDPSKFVGRDDLGNVVDAMVNLAPELMVLAQEHQDLTGQKLDPRALIAELRTRARSRNNTKSLDIRTIWEETNDIATKRQDAAKAKYDADIAAAEERGRMAAATAAAVPGAAPMGRLGAAFKTPSGTARTSVLNRPSAGATVQRAAQALAGARAARLSGRAAT